MSGAGGVSRGGTVRGGWRIVLLTYLSTLLVSLPVAIGFGAVVQRRFGSSLDADRFASGDIILVVELVMKEIEALSSIGILTLGLLPLFFVIWTFVASATVAHLLQPQRSFLEGGGRLFVRSLRLALAFAPIFLLLFGGAMAVAIKGTETWTKGWPDGQKVFLARMGAIVVVLIFGAFLSGAHDIMRFIVATDERARVLRALGLGLWATVSAPHRFLWVQAPYLVGTVVLVAAATTANAQLDRVGWHLIAAGLVLEQGLSYARAGLRVALIRAEGRWYFKG